MKKNFIAKYFENFSIKQVSDILLVLGIIAMIVALFIADLVEPATILIACASGVLVVAFGLGLTRHILNFVKIKKRRHPEFNATLTNTIISSIGLIISIIGLIFALVG